jgi:MFS family permease
MNTRKKSNRALGLVSVAVLLASSTWFSGTAATPVLRRIWDLTEVQCSWLTVSVQLGFIVGTFLYAFLNLSDIFNTRRVFFVSATLGAAWNSGFAMLSLDFSSALIFRFLTGVTLAGVYPVGMKIIAQWFRSKLGWRLGIMVGALTLGTASPYLIMALGADLDWRWLMLFASGLSLVGGLIVLLGLSDGPYLSKSAPFNPRMVFQIFRHKAFRFQAFGYFGHMWELYAFWSLVATFLAASFSHASPLWQNTIPILSFLIIGIGTGSCILGGWISRSVGEKNVALISLVLSGSFCLTSWILFHLPSIFLAIAVLIWGMVVIADSPQFSALAAKYCPPEYTGTALTIQNGIGFGITVISIQLTAWIAQSFGWRWAFVFLAIGPLLGILSLAKMSTAER